MQIIVTRTRVGRADSAPKHMFCSLFFLAWLSVNLGQASTPPIRWSILNSLGLLNIRGGAPDLSSGAKRDLWLGEDLSVGVRDGKFSVMTPKQKAELMIMGSTPTESRSILQVEYVRNVVVPSSHLTHLFRRTNVNQALDTLTPPPPAISQRIRLSCGLPATHPPRRPEGSSNVGADANSFPGAGAGDESDSGDGRER